MCPGLIESLEDQLKAHVFLVAHRTSTQPTWRIFANLTCAEPNSVSCLRPCRRLYHVLYRVYAVRKSDYFFHMFPYTGRIIRKERRGKALYKQKVPLAGLEPNILQCFKWVAACGVVYAAFLTTCANTASAKSHHCQGARSVPRRCYLAARRCGPEVGLCSFHAHLICLPTQ